MSNSSSSHECHRADLLTHFFSSSSCRDDLTRNGDDDISAEILLSKMHVPSFSGGYFGLLEVLGTPMDTLVRSLSCSRDQILKQRSLCAVQEPKIWSASGNALATISPLRFSFPPGDFSDFVEYLYRQIKEETLTDFIIDSPCSMRNSHEIVLDKANHLMTLSIGYTSLKQGYLLTVASRIFFNLDETAPISPAASYMIVRFLQFLIALSESSSSTYSQNMTQLRGKTAESFGTFLPDKRSQLQVQLKLGVCKWEDFLKYTEAVHESVLNALQSDPFRAFMGHKQRLLSAFLSRSAISRLQLEICTCHHFTDNLIYYLAAIKELNSHKSENNHHHCSCFGSISVFSRTLIEKCCILLLFALDCTSGMIILKQQQTLHQLYGLRVRKLVDFISLSGDIQTSLPPSVSTCWDAMAVNDDDNDEIPCRSQRFISKLLLLKIDSSRILLRWMRNQEGIKNLSSRSTEIINDEVLKSCTLTKAISACQFLIRDFFVLCRDVVLCCVLDDILVVIIAVIDLLDSAWCVSFPDKQEKQENDVMRCCSRRILSKNFLLEDLCKSCEECSVKQLQPANSTSSDQLLPVFIASPSPPQILQPIKKINPVSGIDIHLPIMKDSTNLSFLTLFDYLKECSLSSSTEFSTFLHLLHENKNPNLSVIMQTAVALISVRLD